MSAKFAPMLSGTCTDVNAGRFPVLVSPKLDGIRALVRGGVLVSRNLKPIPNVELQMRYGRSEYEGLDGELILGVPNNPQVFRNTTSVVMSHEKDASRVQFYVFDCFEDPELKFSLRLARAERRKNLAKLIVVPHAMASGAEHVLGLDAQNVARGYEGSMLRDPDGPYKFGRSTEKEGWLLKLKTFEDAEAVVIGVEEQMANENVATLDNLGHTKRSTHKAGKRGKGTLGALRVRGLNGTYKGVEFSVGSGFSDAERAELWAQAHGKVLLNRVVKYKYFPTGSKDAPRFPTWLGFRDPGDMS